MRIFFYPLITAALLIFLIAGASASAQEGETAIVPAIPSEVAPAPPVLPAAPLNLEANWLDNEAEFTERHLVRLMEIANRDPETAEILKNAQNVLGAQTTTQLMGLVQICQAMSNTNIAGLADVSAYRRMQSRPMTELVGQEKPDHLAAIKKGLQAKETVVTYSEGPDYVVAGTVQRGSICLMRDSNLRKAFTVFIHELTHIAGLIPNVEDESFLSQYKSEREYIDKIFMVPGGEFEANYKGYRARIRLDGTRAGLPPEVRDAFNDNGDLLVPKTFIDFLLEKEGYAELLKKNYRTELIGMYNMVASKEGFLVSIYNERAAATRPDYSDKIRRTAKVSAHRLQAEIVHLRELAGLYRSRFAAEGISVQ